MTQHCGRLIGARQTAPEHFSDEFPEGFIHTLVDARLSINHGGLSEFGGLWVGEHFDCKRHHCGTVIEHMCADGLLDRVGRPPARTATITETGLMTLDLLGDGQ
jgi:hypothetical protein